MPARISPLALVLTVVGVSYVTLFAANPMPVNVHGDGYYTYLWARTIVFDGDFDFHEDYRICPDIWDLANAPIADDINYWNMGPALFWIPTLAYDRFTGHPSLSAGSAWERNACIGPVAERAVMGSILAGILTAVLGFFGARRFAGPWPAAFGAIGGALLTSLTYYATSLLSYGHAASSFGCGLFFITWDRWRRSPASPRAWLLMGAALGLAMLMRSQNAILAALPFATWCVEAWRRIREGERPLRGLTLHAAAGVGFLVALLVVFSPQMVYLHHATGSLFGVSQGEHYMRWGSPRIANALFSTGGGLFTWTPITYVAFAGWLLMLRWRFTRALGVALLVIFALDTYVVASVYDWWGSVGFPARRFDMLIVPTMYGLAAVGVALRRLTARTRGGGLVVAATVLLLALTPWNFGLVTAIAKAVRIDQAKPAPTHWGAVFREMTEPTWKSVGNPLAWPASIPFALRHGVHPRQWDVLGSQELFYHDHQTLDRRQYESTLELALPGNELYLAGTFQRELVNLRGHDVRVAGRGTARFLLPLHWPELGAVRLTVSPATEGDTPLVRCNFNGVFCGQVRVGRDRDALRFDIPPGVAIHGTNELRLSLEAPVGFGRVELLDPDPPPSVRQRERNEALLRARRGQAPPEADEAE